VTKMKKPNVSVSLSLESQPSAIEALPIPLLSPRTDC